MGIVVTEELVTSVGAILKTLECPICLELLKFPVSTGCGHFFCRECVSGILQSSYRAPCPLCKRSFTRRSVQEAAQRQSVISAAKILANTCATLTGVNFISQDSKVKFYRELDENVPVCAKKLKSSNEKQDNSRRKRKSFENEGNEENVKADGILDLEMKDCNKGNENSPSNKRTCPDSEEDDLPSLKQIEEILSQSQLQQKSPMAVPNETSVSQYLSTKSENKSSELKTYSLQRKIQKPNVPDLFDVIVDDSKLKVSPQGNYQGNSSVNLKTDKNEIQSDSSMEKSRCSVLLNNKINALKNKTNEVHSGLYGKQSEDLHLKQKSLKDKKKAGKQLEDKSKENELCLSPKRESNGVLPLKQKPFRKKLDKMRRKSNTSVASNLSISDDACLQEIEKPTKNFNNNCSNEVAISTLYHADPNEQLKKVTEDPFKSLGLTDTAVSVGFVASPLATKVLSGSKSPGWSRVKEVKKDFKVKKFASLHVEKNSPSVSLKTATEQENISSICKCDPSLATDVEEGVENELDSRNIASHATTNENFPVPQRECYEGTEKYDSSHAQSLLVSEEVSNSNSENVTGLSESSNVDKSSLHEEVVEEMDCSVSASCECSVSNPEEITNKISLNTSLDIAEPKIIINNVPSVSITSNSLICTKYSDVLDKNSSQSITKTKEIICELQNTSVMNSDRGGRKENASEYVVHNIQKCPIENKNEMFAGISQFNQNVLPVPTHISKYQSFYSHSVHDDENFQYVEQSQQTSQVFDFHKAVNDNLKAVVVQQHQPHFFCPIPEKTKVVKRTCLTLEEIQDYFDKSSQSGSSETICNLPFQSGLFKLHIGVSDETLNVSVLKVIDSGSESSTVQNISVFPDKCIQASNSLFLPIAIEGTVVPSSNAESESSQPEASDPFPYLNKQTLEQKGFNSSLMPPNEDALELTHNEKNSTQEDNEPFHAAESSNEENAVVEVTTSENQENLATDKDMDMSEIVHFPPKLNDEIQKNSSPLERIHPDDDLKGTLGNLKEAIIADEQICSAANPILKDCDSPSKTNSKNDLCYQTNIATEIEHIDSDGSLMLDEDEEESFKKLHDCVKKRQSVQGKKHSRLSLKKRSAVKKMFLEESSDESDLETSVSDKKSPKGVVNETLASKNREVSSTTQSFHSPSALKSREKLKKAGHHSMIEEMPTSTLNSMLSEDASETNASEIVLEIQDLSDKIKSLEEKLKQVGSEELNKPGSVPESDSEDSTTDLFPQSVPPTPPKYI